MNNLRRVRVRVRGIRTRGSSAVILWLSAWLLCGPVASLAAPLQQPANSAIVYRCGSDFENLCRFTFDGAPPRQLTDDGVPGGPVYTSPSLSADGTRMAFTFGNFAYVADGNAANKVKRSDRTVVQTWLRPDGGRLATVELLFEQGSIVCPKAGFTNTAQPVGCSTGGFAYGVRSFPVGMVPYLFTYDAAGGDKQTERRVPTTFGWWGNRLISDGSYNVETKTAGVCVMVDGDFKCERELAADPMHTLLSPAMSPDGKTLAVAACADLNTLGRCSIALYAQPSGAFVRNVSAGPNDAAPVWSPDGGMLAFGRDQSIWVVARDGAAGSERMLIEHGMAPTWSLLAGGGATLVPNPAPAAAPNPAPAPNSETAPLAPPHVANLNFADELTDWGVPPQADLQTRVGARTPTSIPGGQVASTVDVADGLARALQGELPLVLIDALKDDHSQTIHNAVRLPDAGQPGTFDDQIQQDLAAALEDQTNGNLGAALVFFCQGARCWESYNASLRAINLGYTNVYWYRGGLSAWSAARLPLE